MKVLIIGGVAAGASAAARLRRLNEEAKIVILEKGDYVSFANCGLPYHVGGDIKKRGDLLVSSPRHLRDVFNVDVRTGHEAVAIDRSQKSVRVRDRSGGEEYEEAYDRLILAQGGVAIRPQVPGAVHPRVVTLRTMNDMDALEALIENGARTAIIVGANYIGLEAAEALSRRGLVIDLIEAQSQVMPVLDPELAIELEREIVKHGIRPHLGQTARSFTDVDGRVRIGMDGGRTIEADLAVLAMGVRPDTALARSAGLDTGAGGVTVNSRMLTSDPDIYAAGDMVEVKDTVTGEAVNLPLAGPANRQGRIAADNIGGRLSEYRSTQGTAIVKVFGLAAALTGATEKTMKRTGAPYRKFHLYPFNHASYYPGAENLLMKILFEPESGRLLGAQVIGSAGADKRIDVLAVAIRAGMSVYDLEDLELAYAPPYGSAKDPVNMAGFVGANIMEGIVSLWYAEEFPERTADGTILDVRTNYEFRNGHVPGAVHIPVDQLRGRLYELDGVRDRPVFVYCLSGVRSYIASRMLMQSGFVEVHNLSGGIRVFNCVHPEVPLET